MRRTITYGIAMLAVLLAAVVMAACAGQPADTDEKPDTKDTTDTKPITQDDAEYVGSSKCAECHSDIADVFNMSGHPYKLNKVVGAQPPEYPYTAVPNPPEGYTWADITYVIGGYNWKARFIDKQGYIITGADENATTQYNLARPDLGFDAGWAKYHAGEVEKPYDCGRCHTTGYTTEGNQDGLPGMVGTWSEPGIRCEECHGAGSAHVDAGGDKSLITIDTSPELCGRCHIRGEKDDIPAKGGFIRHHEQYNEFNASPHKSLGCVTCHDPHEGVVQLRQAGAATTKTPCETCHADKPENQKSMVMKAMLECIDCHMPFVSKSAQGDAAAFKGDVRTHLFAIDAATMSQFNEDGSLAITKVSVEFACKTCHREGGSASVKTDQALIDLSTGYHD